MALRLVLAFAAGAVLGYERAQQHKPAGPRTHALVCVASALFTLISIYGFAEGAGVTRDPARVAAQVVTGMGFIGAGAIWCEGSWVRGITTASTLWVSGALGLAIGVGLYLPALVALGLAYLGLEYQTLTRLLTGRRKHELEVLDLDALRAELERVLGFPVRFSTFDAGDPYVVSFSFAHPAPDPFALTLTIKWKTINLALLYLPKHLRGKGYGRRVVESLLGWAGQQGFQQVVLTSTPEIAPMWKKLGFESVDFMTYVYPLGR